jgi:hypothetical protein
MRKTMAVLAALATMLLLALPASAQESARIHLLHGIPDTNVDVLVDGAPVFEDFAFGDTQDLSALAGETLVGLQVVLAGTDTVAIDAGDTALPASGNYSIIAHLDASGTPTLSVFENRRRRGTSRRPSRRCGARGRHQGERRRGVLLGAQRRGRPGRPPGRYRHRRGRPGRRRRAGRDRPRRPARQRG